MDGAPHPQLAFCEGRRRRMLFRAALKGAKWMSLAERRAMRLKGVPSSMAAAARPAREKRAVRNCIVEEYVRKKEDG